MVGRVPKPKMIVSIVLTDNQNIEVISNRYTEMELTQILDNPVNDKIAFYGCDENDEPVYVSVSQPFKMLGYMLRDLESFVKAKARVAATRTGQTPSGIITPR